MTSLAPNEPTGQPGTLARLATFRADMNVWRVRDGRNADVAAALRSEQMRLIGRRLVVSATSQSAAAAVLVVMLWRHSSPMLLLTWLSCLCAIALLNLHRWYRARKLTAGAGSGDSLGDSAIRHYLYLGLLWGAIVLATVDDDASLAEAFTILIVS